ncbi:hypothetical protein E2562_001373 [Oryza meyeriana var. granulata]|uniref:Uncharacterized protein n=1 Tax=Oryza meyeriana var. granulata TaxID=110450 RepID=A0A6G1DCP7_9ORYZ|nr:hypothetical protein E2562_001373 [Oryza meyeriana var. granulata]
MAKPPSAVSDHGSLPPDRLKLLTDTARRLHLPFTSSAASGSYRSSRPTPRVPCHRHSRSELENRLCSSLPRYPVLDSLYEQKHSAQPFIPSKQTAQPNNTS